MVVGGPGHGREGMGGSSDSSSFSGGWAPKTPPAQDEQRTGLAPAAGRKGVRPATLEGRQRFLLGSHVLSGGVNLHQPFCPGDKQAGFAPVFGRHHCP